MKILLLNPQIDAEHNLLKTLQDRGYTVLSSINSREALQLFKLHAGSTDLLIVQREGFLEAGGKPDDEAGLKFISQIKKDPAAGEIPILLMSEKWSDADCARHQQTPLGANAYLKWPVESSEILKTINEIFQSSISTSPVISLEMNSGGPVLESASQIFETKPKDKSDSAISLDMPEFDSPSKFMEPKVVEIDISSNPLEASKATSSQIWPEGTVALSQGMVQGSPTNATIAIPPSMVLGQSPDASPEGSTRTGMADFVKTKVQVPTLPQTPQSTKDRKEISMPSGLTLAPTQVGELRALGPEGLSEPSVHLSSKMEDFPSEPMPPAAEEPIGEFKDEQAFRDMPYLFGGKDKPKGPSQISLPSQTSSILAIFHPVDDAVVPGGVAQAPDTETLKKYLMLREQDVAVLSNQLKTIREQVAALEDTIQHEKGKNTEHSFTIAEYQRRVENFEKEKANAIEQSQNELNDVRFELKVKTDKAKVMESQLREALTETEKIKDRVRMDIRKIRVREKELENRLEIIKKDSEALLAARESKIIELKRKLDLLEFNMDLLQDQYSNEKDHNSRLSERLERAAQVLRVAGGLLDAQSQGFVSDALAETLGEKMSEPSKSAAAGKSNRRAS